MTRGKRKDGKPNPAIRNLQTGRDRQNLWMMGFPTRMLIDPHGVREEGLKIIEELKVIEAQLTEWEDKQPIEVLELLPWWEDRKRYREMKANGTTPEIYWWEAVWWLEQSKPRRLEDPKNWGLFDWKSMRKRVKERKKAAEAAKLSEESSSEADECKPQ